MIKTNSPQLVCKKLEGRFQLSELIKSNPKQYPYLLESTSSPVVDTEPSKDNFDILFAFPGIRLTKPTHEHLELDGCKQNGNNFFDSLDSLWKSEQAEYICEYDLPFKCGWFLFLSYELSNEVEPTLNKLPRGSEDLPIAVATRIHSAIIYSHKENITYLISEPHYQQYIQEMHDDLSNVDAEQRNNEHVVTDAINITVKEEDPNIYLLNTAKVKRYIKDGDVFQVNLSRLWKASSKQIISPYKLYARLKITNPGGFSGLLNINNNFIISSSPERLVKVNAGQVSTRPIAGTRPRGNNTAQDQSHYSELKVNLKEKAEHVMLIDLERNDLGRLCVPGSIKLDENMTIESYAHVHHIVSNISGKLMPSISPGDTIKAVFPGGTITGCPKVRCMQIISELEAETRQAYTGSVGYLNHDGDMDLNILIRTMTLNAKTNKLNFRAGAGLVADSDQESELNETRAKAKGLILALQSPQGQN